MMLRNIRCQCRPEKHLRRTPGVGFFHLAAPATTAWHRTAPCRTVRLTATATAAAAADAETSQPTAAAAAAAQQGKEITSSSAVERNTFIRISGDTDATKTAAYMVGTLSALGPSAVLLVSAAGPAATLTAFRTLARASEMTAERDSSKVLTLEPRSPKLRLTTRGSSAQAADGDEPQQQRESLSVREFFVRLEPADLYSAEPGNSKARTNPMRVQQDTESSKVADHACRNANRAPDGSRHPVAAFSILPGSNMQERAAVLMNGLAAARKQLRQAGHPGITLTLQRTLVERRVKQDGSTGAVGTEDSAQQQEQQQYTESSSSSSDAEGVKTVLRPSYLVRVYSTLLQDDDATARAERSQAARDRRGAGASEQLPGKVRPGSRRGYVEVPAAEWSALREQLEVVPHLTQQLQTMTRQHEQLLSLLAAQQGGQAGEAAAEPEQAQQQQ